ncbi:MAG: hypothetical protein HY303_07310 [Candidatus Wallbacteria bacterium]|nr:hypothetical protein [Candidatus Wallbacteria bacterium]
MSYRSIVPAMLLVTAFAWSSASDLDSLIGKRIEITKDGVAHGTIQFIAEADKVFAVLKAPSIGEHKYLDLRAGQVSYRARVLPDCARRGDTASFYCDRENNIFLQFATQVAAAGDVTGEWMKRTYGLFHLSDRRPQEASLEYEYHSYDGEGDRYNYPVQVKLELKEPEAGR